MKSVRGAKYKCGCVCGSDRPVDMRCIPKKCLTHGEEVSFYFPEHRKDLSTKYYFQRKPMIPKFNTLILGTDMMKNFKTPNHNFLPCQSSEIHRSGLYGNTIKDVSLIEEVSMPENTALFTLDKTIVAIYKDGKIINIPWKLIEMQKQNPLDLKRMLKTY